MNPSLTILIRLCRISWLPTVWSNCLAGYYLGGAQPVLHLTLMLLGTTLLFLGGAFLDHAFEVGQHGAAAAGQASSFGQLLDPHSQAGSYGGLSHATIWRWGLGQLVLGIVCLAGVGTGPAVLGLVLAGIIIVHHGFHWFHGLGPALLGLCRLCLYLIAAASAKSGITGTAIWCGLAVGVYTAGTRYLVSEKRSTGPDRHWPLLLLGVPIFLGLLLNAGQYRENALLLCVVLGLWTLRHARHALWVTPPDLARAGLGLLAGIVLVDWLAVVHAPRELGFYFIGLFLAAVAFEKLETLCTIHRHQTVTNPGPPTPQTGA